MSQNEDENEEARQPRLEPILQNNQEQRQEQYEDINELNDNDLDELYNQIMGENDDAQRLQAIMDWQQQDLDERERFQRMFDLAPVHDVMRMRQAQAHEIHFKAQKVNLLALDSVFNPVESRFVLETPEQLAPLLNDILTQNIQSLIPNRQEQDIHLLHLFCILYKMQLTDMNALFADIYGSRVPFMLQFLNKLLTYVQTQPDPFRLAYTEAFIENSFFGYDEIPNEMSERLTMENEIIHHGNPVRLKEEYYHFVTPILSCVHGIIEKIYLSLDSPCSFTHTPDCEAINSFLDFNEAGVLLQWYTSIGVNRAHGEYTVVDPDTFHAFQNLSKPEKINQFRNSVKQQYESMFGPLTTPQIREVEALAHKYTFLFDQDEPFLGGRRRKKMTRRKIRKTTRTRKRKRKRNQKSTRQRRHTRK